MADLELNEDNLEEYEPELIDLEDEDGNTTTFEIIDGMEFNGGLYYALIPYTENDEETEMDEDEFVILKEVEKDGDKLLATIDDDKEYSDVGEAFLKKFQLMFAEEDGENLQ